MSVYIKGFPIPKNCGACPLRLAWCRERIYMVTRPGRCPLISVPEHGGLVDLKAPFNAQYYDEMTEEWSEKTVTVEGVLYGCMVDEMPPTIIPADPADKEAYND